MNMDTCSVVELRNMAKKSHTPASLPDITKERRDDLYNDLHHSVVDPFSHSELMGVEGLENGDVRKRVTAYGGDEHELGRFRCMTAKGAENKRKTHSDNRIRAMRRLNRMFRTIDPLLNDVSNLERVRGEMLEADKLFSEVLDEHGKYHALIDDQKERQKSSKWMNDNDEIVFGFKSFVNKWINDNIHTTTQYKQNNETNLQNQTQLNINEHMNTTSHTLNKDQSRLLPVLPLMGEPEVALSHHSMYPSSERHISPVAPMHHDHIPRNEHISLKEHTPRNEHIPLKEHTPRNEHIPLKEHTPRHTDFMTRSRVSSFVSNVSHRSGRSSRSN